jgi:DMSO/TMAO reductase YedYZ heme-binding membrane subunit
MSKEVIDGLSMTKTTNIEVFTFSLFIIVVTQFITIHPRSKMTFGIVAFLALIICLLSGFKLFRRKG